MGKKSTSDPFLSTEERCQIIERLVEQDFQTSTGKKYSVRQLCQLLAVNRAWYYERQKLQAKREKEESELKTAVETLLLEFNGYGYRRVTKALHRQGWRINHKKVLRLLRKWGLLCRPLRKKKVATTLSDPQAPYAENLLRS